jgi:penicillin-binding protein 2
MTVLRNVESELSHFRGRVLVVALVVLLCFGLLLARLVYLQIVRHAHFEEQAENNRTAIVPIIRPTRWRSRRLRWPIWRRPLTA